MLAPGTSVGRYIVKRKLAEGGMAEIYLASAQGPEGFAKDVVLKVVRSYLAEDQQFVDMFIAEARLASRLNHANVVQIFDFGKYGDSYYLAMEYVRGASLWDLRRRCRELGVTFPPLLAAEIITQVARGLNYAHALTDRGQLLGIVHRDVTPHNVLLSFDGGVKLTDFGIAKAGSSHTAPGMLKGKFAYMSPEQARGERVDSRTDTFALGIVAWELLTGGRLFEGDSEVAVLRAVQDSLVAPPSRLNPDVPQELSDLVLKALARNPAERFQTAFELERALAMFLLKHTRSVEDTSVALFLQTMYREEYRGEGGEAPLGSLPAAAPETLSVTPVASVDEVALGDTLAVDRARRGVVPQFTQTATPAPNSTPLAGASPQTEPVPQLDPGPQEKSTDEFTPQPSRSPSAQGGRPKTEQMPELRPSQRLRRPSQPTPAPVEPSAVTDASGPSTTLPDSSLVLRRRSPLVGLIVAALAAAVVGGLGYAWYSSHSEPPASEAPVVVRPTEPAATASPAPLPAPPEAQAAGEVELGEKAGETLDAGVEVASPVAPAVVSAPKHAAAVKLGTLEVSAKPYAAVIVNGRLLDDEVQGKKQFRLAAGVYTVVLKHPKRTDPPVKVTVRPGETVTLTFDYTP